MQWARCVCALPRSTGIEDYVYEYINYVPYRNNVIAAAKYKAYSFFLLSTDVQFLSPLADIHSANSLSQTIEYELQGNTQFTYIRSRTLTHTQLPCSRYLHGHVQRMCETQHRSNWVNCWCQPMVCVPDIISFSPFSTVGSADLFFFFLFSFSLLIKYMQI